MLHICRDEAAHRRLEQRTRALGTDAEYRESKSRGIRNTLIGERGFEMVNRRESEGRLKPTASMLIVEAVPSRLISRYRFCLQIRILRDRKIHPIISPYLPLVFLGFDETLSRT